MKHKLHSWLDAFRWRKLLLIWAVFLAMAAILFAERSGIRYASTQFKIDYLPRAEVKPASIAMFGQPVTCLLLYDSGQEGTDQVKEQFDQILLDMKVGTQAVDVHTTALTSLPEFSQYQTVVVLMSNLDALGKRLIDLMNWVQNGGSVLFAMTPDKTTYFDAISQKLGVQSSAWEYKMVESIVPSEDFMLGGGQRYEFSDPFQSALSVSLREDTTVYARTGSNRVAKPMPICRPITLPANITALRIRVIDRPMAPPTSNCCNNSIHAVAVPNCTGGMAGKAGAMATAMSTARPTRTIVGRLPILKTGASDSMASTRTNGQKNAPIQVSIWMLVK